jgi:hypothetical protein
MFRQQIIITSLITSFILMAGETQAASPFKNTDFLKVAHGFGALYKGTVQRPLKVAVLDKGFLGYEKEIGRSLPRNTRYIPGPVTPPDDLKIEHGLRMAQILYDMSSDNGADGAPIAELRLYNVFGFSNFQAAIADMVAQKVDLVLYSEVWEFGNNFDGQGFIDAEVQKALNAGIIWVNASGNFGLTTFNSGIKTGKDNWVILPDQNQALGFRCQDNPQKKCQVKIVLSWNDFKNDSEIGTDKDLDLALTDDLLNIIEASRLKQTSNDVTKPGESKYPREEVTAELKPGQYFIRVKKSSENFTSRDRLRITVDGDSLLMPSADKTETLLNPADLKGVISVGAWDSLRTGLSVKLKKPDIWALSSIIFEDGREFRGSSNSAAIVAAALVLAKSQKPELRGPELMSRLTFSNIWNSLGLSLNQLGFTPKDDGQCFTETMLPNLPQHIQMMLARGAKLVDTSHGLRLMTSYDPVILDRDLARNNPEDVILMTAQGLKVQARYESSAQDDIEVFQRPQEAGPCYLPQTNLKFLGIRGL